ncbi:MAG TPA: phosphate ABC transporter permease PstA [Myxococcaceae bacterium]|nr:phosphate ABC transporter permease PstA [Myxococcaceae bacterium]
MNFHSSYAYRKAVDRGMATVCAIFFALAFVPLLSVLWLVVSKGAAGLSWDFFTQLPRPVGEEGGGIGNALVGTLYMVGLACVLGLPLGVGAGIYLAEKGDGTFGNTVRFVAEVLSGVPSIVIGIVAYALVVIPMGHFSALAGGVALAILMIPTVARTTEELVRLVPGALREASLALGVPNWKTSLRVVIRTAMGGIVTACLLAVARAAGETAPLIFTALNNQYWNVNPSAPTASLTVAIYNYAISPYDDWHAKAWTASLVLLLVVGLLNIASRFLTRSRLKGAR